MKKMESFVQFPYFLRELWSLNCLKKCIFCNFVLTPVRNLSLLKQFMSIYASERSRYALSENGIVYHVMTYCFGDTRV